MSLDSTLDLSGKLSVESLQRFTFRRESFKKIRVSSDLYKKIGFTFKALQNLIDNNTPIYGVTTGFGESCTRYVDRDHADQLQKNLIEYLSCGQGRDIPVEASRAMFLIRLNSLLQGISGVSPELIERMCLLLEQDIVPRVPCEGSLGASGDLVPLAYLGQVIQGYGDVYYQNRLQPAGEVLKKLGLGSYKLKPKEGLAIVNGTSTMAGMVLYNLQLTQFLI
ncbi:MAG: aromatic amino acid lyase, partial [Pseudobdellovibrionaceae bacterium]